MVNKSSILEAAKEKTLAEYDSFSSFTNKDEGKKMVIFCSKELSCKDVDNWGRQESSDFFIGIDENGWIRYEHTVQYFNGPLKISNPVLRRLSENEVLDYLDGADCTNKEFLSFWSKANEVLL